MMDSIAAEWLKLRSARSSWYALAGALAGVVVPAAIAWDVVGIWDSATPAMRPHLTVAPLTVVGAWLVDLCLAALGILSITAEYATGMIRASLCAVPRRGRLLAAKAAVVAAVSLAVGEAIVFASFVGTRWIVGDRPIRGLTAPVAREIPVLLSLGLGAMVFALVGLGLGVILRSAAGAFALIVAFLYLGPIIALHLPAPWGQRVSAVMLPTLAGEASGAPQLAGVVGPALSPPWALMALAIYVAAALGIAAWLIHRRDA